MKNKSVFYQIFPNKTAEKLLKYVELYNQTDRTISFSKFVKTKEEEDTMPIYEWICDKCKKEAVVQATVDNRDNPPPKTGPETEEPCYHEWRRQCGTVPFCRADTWSGRKGEW